jgi:predicted transcriptional regulator
MPVTPLDTLLAIKIMNLVPGLRPSDRRVGVTLIEHFNRRTGRCDPGVERIAELLGVCTRTVMRSTERLAAIGLFRKIRHGGYSNRNSYEPNWSRFAELEAGWKRQLQKKLLTRHSKMSLATRESCHFDGDTPVTQTYGANLQELTSLRGYQSKLRVDPRIDRTSVRPIASRMKPGDAALAAAERRWTDALYQCFKSLPVTYGEIIAAIDEPMQAAATEAEMCSRGAGFLYILRQLKIPGR